MKRRPRKMVQLDLPVRTWGGRRAGAGRPKKPGGPQAHVRRPEFPERFPLHVTLRVRHDVGNLRTDKRFKHIKRAFRLGRDRFGMRLTEFSVQTNRVHLIVEAEDKRSLARGLQGLSIRVARGVNRASGRRGGVFADRYHAHVLKTLAEVRNAVHYVRRNWHKHERQRGHVLPPGYADPFSSASDAALWDLAFERGELVGTLVIARPATWMLRRATAPPSV